MRALALVVLLVSGAARAEVDPDTERAQGLFAEGAAAYEQRDYARAITKMEAARALKPAPAFDYNIARCHDRLGHTREALAEYERFAAAAPQAPEIGEVRARIDLLRARAQAEDRGPRSRLRYVAPTIVGGFALSALVVGAGLAGSVPRAYGDLEDRLAREGESEGLSQDAKALRARNLTGILLLGVGGAVAVADLALWGVAVARYRRGR